MGNIFAKKLTLQLGEKLVFIKPEPNYNGAYPIFEFMASVQTWFETLGWNEKEQKLIKDRSYKISKSESKSNNSDSDKFFLIMYFIENEQDSLQFKHSDQPYNKISLNDDISLDIIIFDSIKISKKSNNTYVLELVQTSS